MFYYSSILNFWFYYNSKLTIMHYIYIKVYVICSDLLHFKTKPLNKNKCGVIINYISYTCFNNCCLIYLKTLVHVYCKINILVCITGVIEKNTFIYWFILMTSLNLFEKIKKKLKIIWCSKV